MLMQWYRSLYWRVAVGVVACLAAMLVVQAVFFVWAVSQSGRTLPGQSPVRLAQTVAVDPAGTLERDPQVDLSKYLREQYSSYTHPFFVMLADGRVVTSGSRSFPEPLLRAARARLQAPARVPRVERTDGDRGEREGGGLRGVRPAPILVAGRVAGVVVVPPQAPFWPLLTRFAPMLALVGGAVLVVGTVLTSVLIFG